MQTPAPFEYERATSVDHALALLERHGPEARLVAGGHSLLPMMKLRLARPEVLIDINDLTDLDYIRVDGDEIAIGAMTRHADAARVAAARRALPHLRATPSGSSPTRSCATAARSAARSARPTRPRTCPPSASALRADDGDPLGRRARARCRPASSTTARTRPSVGAGRDPHRGAGADPARRRQRLREGRAAGRRLGGRRRRRVRARCDGDTVADVGIGLTAVGAAALPCADGRGRPARQAGHATRTSPPRPQICRRRLQPVRPTSAARSTTSATSPAS